MHVNNLFTIKTIIAYKRTGRASEASLVEGCLMNNRKAQKMLYERYCDAMYTIAYRITNDISLAGDVLQEVFIQVFSDLAQFRGEASLGSWIKTITVRTAVRKIRTESTFSGNGLGDSDEPVIWPEAMTGSDLEKAILSLPEGARTVFLLVEVEGYKHREVAEMLSISEGTSKSQLNFAKRKLQTLLKDFTER